MVTDKTPLALIVEDDHDSQFVMKQILKRAGISSHATHDTDSATRALLSQRYDLAVIDVGLPGGDGIALVDAIRHAESLRPIGLVVVTAYHSPRTHERAEKAGCDLYFAKPINVREFCQSVRQLLGLVDAQS